MIFEEVIYNPKYSSKWNESVFIPELSFRNLKMVSNFLLARISYNLGLSKIPNYPHFALIDPSSICHLHCPLCPTGQGRKERRLRLLTFEEYKKMIDQFGDYLVSLLFTNWGEPLLNKDFYKIVEYSKKNKRIPYVSTATNLSIKLTDEDIDLLVESGLDLMTVSVDGSNQETYEKYRVGGDLELVIENSKRIMEAKRRLGKERPFIVWQFLVFKHNEDDIESIKTLAEETGVDVLRICAAQVYVGELDRPFEETYEKSKPVLPTLGSKYSKYNSDGSEKEPKSCNWLWKGIVVSSTGGVSPCCSIYPEKYDFGNLLNEPFMDVWNNRHYQHARRCVKNSNLCEKEPENICTKCTKLGNWI